MRELSFVVTVVKKCHCLMEIILFFPFQKHLENLQFYLKINTTYDPKSCAGDYNGFIGWQLGQRSKQPLKAGSCLPLSAWGGGATVPLNEQKQSWSRYFVNRTALISALCQVLWRALFLLALILSWPLRKALPSGTCGWWEVRAEFWGPSFPWSWYPRTSG